MCQGGGPAWVNTNVGVCGCMCVAMRRLAGGLKFLKLVSMRSETKNQQFLF